ncbi:MAG: hypothetical protein ACOX2M_01325 [Fastidiosipilaceae bacterium]|jgi:hypothetical protein
MDEILFYGGIVVSLSFALTGVLLFVRFDIPGTFRYLRRFSSQQSRGPFSGPANHLSKRSPKPDGMDDDATQILQDTN